MRNLRPELMICAYHQAAQRKAARSSNRWEDFVQYASDPVPTKLREVLQTSSNNSGRANHELLTPEDVHPGFEVGIIEQREQLDPYMNTTKMVDHFEPRGHVIAVFHDYSRTQPVIFADASGEAMGLSTHLPVAVRPGPVPGRCQFDCGTDRIVTGLLWLLRRLHGSPIPDPVHPQYIEDAAPIALVWNLIRRDVGNTPLGLTPAGRIWLLAHYRATGIELEPATAPRRSIQNIFDTRGANGTMNVNLNQGNYGQGNVNFGNQGPVAQGPHASITSVQSEVSSQDYESVEQILDLVHRHNAELRLTPEQGQRLTEATHQMRQALGQRELGRAESVMAGRTILELTREVLVKVAPTIALGALEKITGTG